MSNENNTPVFLGAQKATQDCKMAGIIAVIASARADFAVQQANAMRDSLQNFEKEVFSATRNAESIDNQLCEAMKSSASPDTLHELSANLDSATQAIKLLNKAYEEMVKAFTAAVDESKKLTNLATEAINEYQRLFKSATESHGANSGT